MAARATTPGAAEAEARGAVSGLVRGFIESWNRHDMAALFAADADFVNVVGLW